jgi:hypothetical protein
MRSDDFTQQYSIYLQKKKKKNLAKPSKHLVTSQVICMHKNNSSNKKKNIQSPNSDHLIKWQMFHKASNQNCK